MSTPVALKIRDVQTYPVLVPMRRQLRTSSGAITQAPLLLIDLHTAEGVTGHSYEYVDWAAPVLREPLELAGGALRIPDRPGLGLAWNDAAVARFRP